MKTNDSLELTMIRGIQRKMRGHPVHSICPPPTHIVPESQLCVAVPISSAYCVAHVCLFLFTVFVYYYILLGYNIDALEPIYLNKCK